MDRIALRLSQLEKSKADQNRCADILRRAGWTKGQKKVGGRPLKVWLPPTEEKVSTPLGGYQGVDTAEATIQQSVEATKGEVSTPEQRNFFSDEITSEQVKNIEVEVDTFLVEKAANPLSDCHPAVSTPEVSTPEADTEAQPLKVGDKVFWSECCSNLAPFEIMNIDGDCAKLDLVEKPIPIAKLSRA